MKRSFVRFATASAVAVALAAGFVVGCAPPQDEDDVEAAATAKAAAAEAAKPVVVGDADRQEADKLFVSRCATCHGETGRGDGPGAAPLVPKPRDYHDAEWQKTVSDEAIEKTIVYGGAAVGKSAQMVPNPDLAAKPAVVAALREKIRSFASQPEGGTAAPAAK